MLKNEAFWPMLVTIVMIILIINGARAVIESKNSIKRMDKAEAEIKRLEEENSKLEKDVEYAKTNEFVEKNALERLNMTQPDNKIIIVDAIEPNKTSEVTQKIDHQKPNWMLWREKFNL